MHNQPEQNLGEFHQQFRGAFYGILKWDQLDTLWKVVDAKADDGWYIYVPGEAPPQQPASAEHVKTFITEINQLLRKEHQEDYCGVVYVDNKDAPTFIKIYDPNNMGVVCGFSDNPPLPGWVLSQTRPEYLDSNTFNTKSRRRWWKKIFSS